MDYVDTDNLYDPREVEALVKPEPEVPEQGTATPPEVDTWA